MQKSNISTMREPRQGEKVGAFIATQLYTPTSVGPYTTSSGTVEVLSGLTKNPLYFLSQLLIDFAKNTEEPSQYSVKKNKHVILYFDNGMFWFLEILEHFRL